RYVYTPRRQCPIRSPMEPSVQVLEIALEVCLVLLPRQPVRSGCGILLKFVERLFEKLDTLVVCGPAHLTHFPGPVPGARFAGPHSPWSPPLAPPAPWPVARPCSSASQL